MKALYLFQSKSGSNILREEINLIVILAIVAGAVLAIILVERLIPWIAGRLPNRLRFYILPLIPILRLLIWIIAIAEIFPRVVNITPDNIFAIVGAIGLAVGFAFKDYVSSIIAGIVAIYERPYRPGDWVSVDGNYGEVQSVGMRAFKLITPDDTAVTVPHAKLWTTNIANANDGQREHMCVAEFYLDPVHNANVVRQALWDVAMTSPYTQLAKPVIVIVMEKPWGTHYRLKAYPIDGRDEFPFISDLTVCGKAALAHLGVRPANAQTALPVV